MTAHPAYDSLMEYRPRFLDHGLPANGVLTVDDLHALPEDPHWKYELLEGALLVTPNAPGLRHQSCALSLAIRLREVCPSDVKVVIAPFEYRPEGEVATQPDVMIARRPVGEKLLTQTPVLVVEVLSRGTGLTDRTAKRGLYEKRGVEHYWIVDPAGPSIEALRLVDGGYVIEAKADAGQMFEVSEPVALRFDPIVLLDD